MRSQLIDMLLRCFLKHIKSFTRVSLDFLIKSPRDVDEDNEVVTFDVISLDTSILRKFGSDVLDYFLTTYQEDLKIKDLKRFKKEFELKPAIF